MAKAKKVSSNGHKKFQVFGNKATFFYKNGKVQAQGMIDGDKLIGEWKFYRDNGQLLQAGHFSDGKKNGTWIQYDKKDQVETEEIFKNDKLVKSPAVSKEKATGKKSKPKK